MRAQIIASIFTLTLAEFKVDNVDLIKIGLGLFALFGFWMKQAAFEKAFAERMKLLMRSGDEPSKTSVGPQPFVTMRKEEFVERGSYHKHCELNREEHTRLDAKLTSACERISHDVHGLACEVAAIKSLREANGESLKTIAVQINDMAATVNQTAGVLQALSQARKDHAS